MHRRRTVLLLSACLSPVGSRIWPSLKRRAPFRVSARSLQRSHRRSGAADFNSPAWIRAVLAAKKQRKPRAVSPKGAMGFDAMMPATWQTLQNPAPARRRTLSIRTTTSLRARRSSGCSMTATDRPVGSPPTTPVRRYEERRCGDERCRWKRGPIAAVAPNLTGDGNPGITLVATTDPRAWTRSALFVVRGSRTVRLPIPRRRTSVQRPPGKANHRA